MLHATILGVGVACVLLGGAFLAISTEAQNYRPQMEASFAGAILAGLGIGLGGWALGI